VLAEAPSLLITDDDTNFRETLCGLFEPSGFRLLRASDGQEALEILRAEKVHLIIADMHMPRLTGLEMIRQIRVVHTSLPCILLSAEADEWLVEQARLAQVFSVQRKPVSRRKIVGLVSAAMRTAYDWPAPELPGTFPS
jgi:CheY-like chemotaxis protein